MEVDRTARGMVDANLGVPDRMEVDKTVREMVQAKLLGRIFANSLNGELALKGGMALRVSTDTARHTKDIDLMSPPGADQVEGRIKTAIAELKASGLVSGMIATQPKRTDTTWRWKIGGRVGATVINLTVEVSRRAPLPNGHVPAVPWAPPPQYGVPAMLIDCLDLPMLAASKVSCLANPQREAPRDIFDLHLLVTMHVRPPIEALRAFGREHLEHTLASLWDKLEKMDYATAKTELFPFLEPAMRTKINAGMWDEIRLTAGTAVESWILEALDRHGGATAAACAVAPSAAP